MKTTQIMIREDCIEQNIQDSYFNATLTILNWNKSNQSNKKEIGEYKRLKSTNDFIKHLESIEGIKSPYRSSNKGTWMHPLLYVDFCMWISLEFKTMALKYVLDGLIKTIHSAGDYFNEMCAVVMDKYIERNGCKPPSMIYINEAKMIKDISGVNVPRNEMTENELNKITILQKVNTTLIKDNVGKDSRLKQLELISRSL